MIRVKSITKKAAWLSMLPFYFLLCSTAISAVGYDIYLTNQMESGRPSRERQTQFDCSDRIHVVIFVAGLTAEEHELKVRWMDPGNGQRELTKFRFMGVPTGSEVWAWLQLHGPTGAVIGQMFDPSYGMDEFIGDWNAQVYIDGEQVATQVFQVLC